MTPTTDERVQTTHERVMKLQQQLDALPHPDDVPNTPREQREAVERRTRLGWRINQAHTASRTLADCAPQIAKLEPWLLLLQQWDRQLQADLDACPTDPPDPAAYAHKHHLELSLQRVNTGLDLMNGFYPAHLPLDDLMAAAGYVPRDLFARAANECWFGCLREVERTLAELKERRAEAQQRLDDALRGEG